MAQSFKSKVCAVHPTAVCKCEVKSDVSSQRRYRIRDDKGIVLGEALYSAREAWTNAYMNLDRADR